MTHKIIFLRVAKSPKSGRKLITLRVVKALRVANNTKALDITVRVKIRPSTTNTSLGGETIPLKFKAIQHENGERKRKKIMYISQMSHYS